MASFFFSMFTFCKQKRIYQPLFCFPSFLNFFPSFLLFLFWFISFFLSFLLSCLLSLLFSFPSDENLAAQDRQADSELEHQGPALPDSRIKAMTETEHEAKRGLEYFGREKSPINWL
jgi:hypothetical protein